MLNYSQAEKIIDSLDMREVIGKVTSENPEAMGFEMNCYLDLSDGDIFTRPMSSGESFQENHYILIYSQQGNFRSYISDEDIAGDDEIPDGGVEMFPDYEERVIECMIYYAVEGKDEKQEVYARLQDYYEKQEAYN
jgi:hypothetical protein